MTAQTTLKPGEHENYSTQPVGMTTTLFVTNGNEGTSEVSWWYVLCCEPRTVHTLDKGSSYKTDISGHAGAMVTVANTGFHDITVWTDY